MRMEDNLDVGWLKSLFKILENPFLAERRGRTLMKLCAMVKRMFLSNYCLRYIGTPLGGWDVQSNENYECIDLQPYLDTLV